MEQRLTRLEESYERGFSRLEETYERGFSRLEEMIAELCERRGLLMRRIDGDEEQYPVMNDETDLLGTRTIVDPKAEIREGLVHKAISEKESIPQFQVPIANAEIVRRIEPGKVDLGLENEDYVVLNEKIEQEGDQQDVNKKIDVVGDVERDQKVMSNTKVCSAHQLFDVIPRRTKVLPKEHETRFHKSWRFKFKDKAQPRELIKGKMGVHEANASQGQQAVFEKLVMMNERLQTSLVIEQEMRDKKIKFTKQWMFKFKMDSKPARTNHLLHQERTPRPELAGRKMNHGVFIRLHSKQQRKCSKSWMFKFRKKKIDQQLGCDPMVTCLDNQTTWTSKFDEEDQGILQLRTENSLSRRSANAHGMITRGKDGTVKPNPKHSLLDVQRIWEKEAHEVDNFEWKMQTTTFQSDNLLISLQGIDMNQKVWLHGIKSGSVRDIKAKKLQKIQEDQVQLTMLCVHKAADKEQEDFCTLNALTADSGDESAVDVVLEKFPEVIAEPTELPPFKQIDRCGEAAYKLQLPSNSQIQPVFHVSQLRILVGNVPTTTHLSSVLQDVFEREPEQILARQMVKRQGRAVTKILVKWLNEPVEEATWEFLFEIQKKYPDFEA